MDDWVQFLPSHRMPLSMARALVARVKSITDPTKHAISLDFIGFPSLWCEINWGLVPFIGILQLYSNVSLIRYSMARWAKVAMTVIIQVKWDCISWNMLESAIPISPRITVLTRTISGSLICAWAR